MALKWSFFAVVLVASTLTARAQETGKIYSIANTAGEALTVSAIWADDSENFVVEPLETLPFAVPANGTIDFKANIRPRDGSTHSTEVWYRDTHGNIMSYAVTMNAPSLDVASFSGNTQAAQPPHDRPVYPNPATEFCTVNVDIRLYPNVQVDVFNDAGARVVGDITPSDGKLTLDARNLSSGRYHIIVTSNGNVVKSEEVVVRH